MNQNSDRVTLKETWQIHWRCFKDIRSFCPGSFAVTTIYEALKAFSPYVMIWLSAQIIDELAGLRRPEALWSWVTYILIASVLLTIVTGIMKHWSTVLENRFHYRKNYVFTRKMLSMDFSDVDKMETHDLRSQIIQNENWFGWGMMYFYVEYGRIMESLFGVLGSIALTVSLFTRLVPETVESLTFLNHPVFILILIIILFAITCISSMMRSKSFSYWPKLAEDAKLGNRHFNAFSFLANDQSRAMDFRIYHQHVICRKYMDISQTIFGSRGRMANMAKGPVGIWTGMASAVNIVLTAVVYIFVCLKSWAGAFGVGSITQYVSAVTALSKNISQLMEGVAELKSNVPFMRTIYEYLDIPNSMYQGSLTTEKRMDRKYEVEFKDVSFKYPGSDNWTLCHVNLKFKIGNRLAIVGENGSGKTTFIKLLCRLYDPQEGQILLNGIDIRKYNYQDYMNIFSVVFQDFQLICQSLGANVAGSMKYDSERVRKALIDAGFGEKLLEMDNNLDTMLYKDLRDEGIDVSGGEAQKIAIARALYKDAPFIILDEPTAALDPITEAEIYSKFNDIVGDKTAIYISHRLSSCKFCDEIVVFSKGTIIQQGTHNELVVDEDGKYYELWQAQAQYYN